MVSIRIAESDIETARRQAAEAGLPYQTCLKSLLHQAEAQNSLAVQCGHGEAPGLDRGPIDIRGWIAVVDWSLRSRMRSNGAANVISALTARAKLGQIMQRATKRNERFVVDRRGKPAVVIMSINDYIDTFAPTPAWLEAIHAEAKSKGLDKITMRQIDAEVAAVRKARRKRKLASTIKK